MLSKLLPGILILASLANAQFPPSPQGITTKQSTLHPGVSISYKETTICETKAKAWAGYVHMPTSYLNSIETPDSYNISMFFWYFSAREDPGNAPTGIYLAGGPGQSSVYGAASDGGPCSINADSNSTTNNPWSMNNKLNMLFVDQPVGTGYSYNELMNSTLDQTFHGTPPQELSGIVAFEEWGGNVPAQNTTFVYGTLPSQKPLHVANTTGVAAVTLWYFFQTWFSEFPEYTTSNKAVNMFGNSYGGYFVTGSAAYFQKQNVKIQQGDISGTVIELNTIGFTNGCVDQLYQAEWYPQQAYDNVYNFPLINKTVLDLALHYWSKPSGCKDLIEQCRALGDKLDPEEFGINPNVNKLCLEATEVCGKYLVLAPITPPYSLPSVGYRSAEDIAHFDPDPFPPNYLLGFFNQEWVQKELGVPVNFTGNSNLVETYMTLAMGDAVRRAGMKDVEYLLDAGVKVNFIYGDRDMRCPWVGMEKLSLAANWTGAQAFRAAGYEYIQTNASYEGGVVRQYGNLSFSRVFQAGHNAYIYQPETVYNIFNRAIFDTDIATGQMSTSGASNNYSSTGPSTSDNITLKLPSPPPYPNCNLWAVDLTCTENQLLALQDGTAEINDFTVVKPSGGGGPIVSVPQGRSASSSSSSGDGTSKGPAAKSAGSGWKATRAPSWILLSGMSAVGMMIMG